MNVSVACGNCGGNVFMATCDHFRGTGHEWALVGLCMICRNVHWIDQECQDCAAADLMTRRRQA